MHDPSTVTMHFLSSNVFQAKLEPVSVPDQVVPNVSERGSTVGSIAKILNAHKIHDAIFEFPCYAVQVKFMVCFFIDMNINNPYPSCPQYTLYLLQAPIPVHL